MSKRDKYLSMLVVTLLIAAAWVIYSGLFGKELDVVRFPAPDTDENQKTIVNLLPYGSNFDTSALEKRSRDYNLSEGSVYSYPGLNFGEVGVAVDQLLILNR